MRKCVIATLLVSALIAAGAAQAVRLGRIPPMPPGSWHATINVVIGHQPHTLVYDRGRVTAVGTSSYTVHEQDGSIVTINVDASTRIMISGQPATLAQIRPLEIATSVSIDGGPAARVQVRIPPRVAAFYARQAAKQGQAQSGGG